MTKLRKTYNYFIREDDFNNETLNKFLKDYRFESYVKEELKKEGYAFIHQTYDGNFKIGRYYNGERGQVPSNKPEISIKVFMDEYEENMLGVYSVEIAKVLGIKKEENISTIKLAFGSAEYKLLYQDGSTSHDIEHFETESILELVFNENSKKLSKHEYYVQDHATMDLVNIKIRTPRNRAEFKDFNGLVYLEEDFNPDDLGYFAKFLEYGLLDLIPTSTNVFAFFHTLLTYEDDIIEAAKRGAYVSPKLLVESSTRGNSSSSLMFKNEKYRNIYFNAKQFINKKHYGYDKSIIDIAYYETFVTEMFAVDYQYMRSLADLLIDFKTDNAKFNISVENYISSIYIIGLESVFERLRNVSNNIRKDYDFKIIIKPLFEETLKLFENFTEDEEELLKILNFLSRTILNYEYIYMGSSGKDVLSLLPGFIKHITHSDIEADEYVNMSSKEISELTFSTSERAGEIYFKNRDLSLI